MTNDMIFDATAILEAASQKHGIDLAILVAETAHWAHPDVPKFLAKENGDGSFCFFPKTRRFRKNKGEKKCQIVEGVRLDDNSYANHALKKSLGVGRTAKDWEVCHIWPASCYDEECHTAIPNLVLLPRPLAGLSDYSKRIQDALQFRSFELYGWHPKGAVAPSRPNAYPTCWRAPLPFNDRIATSIRNRRAKRMIPA